MSFGPTVQIQSGAKEPIVVMVVDNNGDPITGLIDIKLKVRRNSDGFYLDWFDNTFKATVTQLLQALGEVSAIFSPGEYHLSTVIHVDGFDTSTFTGALPEEVYFFTAIQDGGSAAANVPQIGEIKVGGYVDNVVEDRLPVIF